MLYSDALSWVLFVYGPLAVILSSFAVSAYASTATPALPLRVTTLAELQTPFTFLLFISLSLYRAHAGVFLGGAFCLSPNAVVWALLTLGALALAFAGSKVWLTNWRGAWAPELFASLGLLTHFWVLAFMARSFFTFILLLELSGLCLLLLILVGGGDRLQARSVLASHNQSSIGPSISSALTFLWVSIFALFAMMWAAQLHFPHVGSYQFDAIGLLKPFNQASTGFAFLLSLAFLLKLMVLPWQSALFAFYKELPLRSLLLYMAFYYPPFLCLGVFILAPLASLLSPAAVFFLFSLAGAGALAVGLVQTPAADLRTILAISSFFNIALLLAAALLSA